MHFTEEQLSDLMVAVQDSNHNGSQVTLEWTNEKEEFINRRSGRNGEV